MRVLQGTGGDQPGPARLVGKLRTALLPARTRLMLLLGLFGAAAAAAVELYPAPVGVLFCLLMAAACSLTLRVPALPSLLVAALGAAALVVGRLASLLLQANPGADGTGSTAATAPLAAALSDAPAWAGLLLGAVILAGSSLLAISLSRALARQVVSPAGSRRGEIDGRPAVLSLDSGLTKAEWELARAAHYRRPVTLCLLGLDRPQGEGERLAPESTMLRVDQFLVAQLSRFEAVAEHRPGERLLLLPEVWADGFVEEAQRLCHLAGQRAGRPVRGALVTFPFHGTRAEDLLAELELALERCRGGNLLVSVGTPAPDQRPATGFAS